METLYTILAIAACVLLFSFAIFIHEFGHFLAARWRGLRVDAFSIGFGPVLWKKKISGVEWRISAIPFGGYVAIPDVDPEGTAAAQGSQGKSDVPAGKAATPLDSIIVAAAGPLGNVALAVVLALLLAIIPGVKFGEMPALIGEVPDKGPAHEAGMKAGDKVVSVGGVPIRTWTEMQTEVQISGGKSTEFVVEREKEGKVKLSVVPIRNEASGAYYIYAFSTTNSVKAAAWMPARNPLKQLKWDVMNIVRVLKALVTPKESKAAAQALGGPVMIAQGLYTQVRNDVWDAFGFLRFLCINLSSLNLLRIPVLDGSLILFSFIELVTRRKLSVKFINVLTRLFMYLLIAAMLFLVYRDSIRSWKVHKAIKDAESAEKAENAK
ncbi:MAG: site-2 protease family protein [Kiritimatiellae bacterium]|nr:site-2 protease family protein [Kiritimatiellia bacterium]